MRWGSRIASSRAAAPLIFSTGLSISVRPSTGERGVSRLTVRIAIVLAGLAVVATSAEAQRRMRGGRAVLVDRPSVGPRVGYDFDPDRLIIGVHINLTAGRR